MNTESMGTGMPGGTQAKKAIYELAKELGVVNKDLVAKIRALGIEAKNHMSRLTEEDVERVKRAFAKERPAFDPGQHQRAGQALRPVCPPCPRGQVLPRFFAPAGVP